MQVLRELKYLGMYRANVIRFCNLELFNKSRLKIWSIHVELQSIERFVSSEWKVR